MFHLNEIDTTGKNKNEFNKTNFNTNTSANRLDLRSKSFGCEKDLHLKGLNRNGLNVRLNVTNNQKNCPKKTNSGKRLF